MTRQSSSGSGHSRPDPVPPVSGAEAEPRYIAGPPLRQGTLYRPEENGTVLVAHAALGDTFDFSDNKISPSQFSIIQGQGMGDTRRLEQLPDGLSIAIPEDLIRLVINAFGEERLGSSAIAEVRRVSELAAEVGGIGFWNQRAIHYRFLEPPRSNGLLVWEGTLWGRSESEIRQVGKMLQERLDRIDQYVRGYVGWLMSNPSFRSEQRQLLQEFRVEIAAEGFPARRAIRNADPATISIFHERCLLHYDRWILDGVEAPDLPIPVAPQFPAPMPAETSRGILSHTIPAYFPVSGQGWMADMLSDARPTDTAMPQLSEWFAIIQKDDAKLNRISGYCRRLRLLHYWRGLMVAFPKGLRIAKTRMASAFADFLKVSDDTIKDDLKVLGPVLRETWIPHE